MSINLIEIVKGQIGQELISKAASMFGESEGSTAKAVESIVPAIFSGLLSKASTPSGAQGIMSMLTEGKFDSNMLSNVSSMVESPAGSSTLLSAGSSVIKSLFGDKADGIVDFVSNQAGIKTSSASGLMSLAAPMIMSTIGQQTQKSGLNAGGIASLLMGQADHLKSLLPAGLASVMGIGSFDSLINSAKSNIESKVSGVKTSTMNTSTESTSGGFGKWLLPLLLVLGALALLFFFLKGCNKTTTDAVDNTTTLIDSTVTATTENVATEVKSAATSAVAIFDSLTGTVNYDLGSIISHKLPNGVEIKYAEKGSEAQLIDFIENGTVDSVDKSKGWMNLYDVQFVKNLEYRNGSLEQIANIGAILKAYPNVKIKLGGYTDNSGPADVNQKLSQGRADKVKAELAKAGVGAQITKAEGYGPQFPACEANDSPACKAQNRRVSLRVVQK